MLRLLRSCEQTGRSQGMRPARVCGQPGYAAMVCGTSSTSDVRSTCKAPWPTSWASRQHRRL
jgi:hypothetical protein